TRGPADQPQSPGESVPTRRQALQQLGLASVVGLSWARCSSGAAQVPRAKTAAAGDDALDEAYRVLHRQEPQCKEGLSTHAPMAAEALCALGHGERAVAWIENYNAPIRPLPGPSSRIERNQWRAALGPRVGAATWEAANARWGDWKEFFLAELSEGRWQDV